MTSDNVLLFVSVGAMLVPVAEIIKTVARVLSKHHKILVVDKKGDVVFEMSPETVQHADLKELERVHDRIRSDEGITLRAV